MLKFLINWFWCKWSNEHTFDLHMATKMLCPTEDCLGKEGVFTRTACCKQWMFVHVPWELLETHPECRREEAQHA